MEPGFFIGAGAEMVKKADDKIDGGLNSIQKSLRTRIKLYRSRAGEIEEYLSAKPHHWGKLQSEFNSEVNGIFREIMNFEKENLMRGRADRPAKLKRLFINRIRDLFMKGVYIEWSLKKPYGYAGDFKIIDDIYLNDPATTGFDRLFDNYYQMSSICVAVRNRKEDFKRLLVDFINNGRKKSYRVMSLASGSCRELSEILSSNALRGRDVTFDCYDNEQEALDFAKGLLPENAPVNLVKQNALKMSATKKIGSLIGQKYDFIYSAGLFDYLNHRISARLVTNLKQVLNPGGVLAISNVRDKYSNPSVHFMEWVGDWNLIYRSDEEFKNSFLEAGFRETELKTAYEQQGIMQYIVSCNTRE